MARKDVASFHLSRYKYFLRYIALIVIFVVGVAAYVLAYPAEIYAILIVVAIISAIILEIKVRTNKISLDKEGVTIELGGLFSKDTTRVPYHSIAHIKIAQTFRQKLFGYGDLELGVPGVMQQIAPHFAGHGDIKIESIGARERGLVFHNFQKIRQLESLILAKAREGAVHPHK